MEIPDDKKRKLEETENGTEAHATTISKDELKQMLEPLTKEQLVALLASVGSQYAAVADQINELASKDPANRKLFVRGLAWETNTQNLREAFAQYGDIEEGAVIVDKITGKSRGFGFITFKDMRSAYSALREPSKRIDGRMTVCNLAAQGGQGGGPIGGGGGGGGGGMSSGPPSVQSGDISQRKLYVGSLSYDTTSETLLNFFSQYGEIEEGAVAYDKNTNKSRGFAFVTFKAMESARRACQEPTKTIDGRQVVVKVASEGQKEKAAQQAAAQSPMIAQAQAQAQAMSQMQQQGMQASYGSPYAVQQQMAYRPQVAATTQTMGMAYGSPAGVATYSAQPSYGLTGTPQYTTSPVQMQQQYAAYAAAQPYQTAAGSTLGMGTAVATTAQPTAANMPLYFTGTQ